ncbi:28S ribosomal protein S14, mitochondrial [Portunus trituberculatus]|uniref:28S ribosomal protein S14, mitochondrial n=1 Tax=Portunus trituberculatus TaxID=210409 RepID=A0A5B7GP81_PORTR|nr:28S ribosomal protein S14, mitochondrial [Portunus trituberculatus]
MESKEEAKRVTKINTNKNTGREKEQLTTDGAASSFHTTAVTHKYPNWKMIKEVKHRKLVKEYAFERININAMRKNKILPAELKVLY